MSRGLAIVGYGKMGQLIEQLAPEYGFEVRAKFDGRSNVSGRALSHETLRNVDAAVEFTSAQAAPENIRRLAMLGVNTVAGTTGWFGELSSVREAVVKSGTGLVWAAPTRKDSAAFRNTLDVVIECMKLDGTMAKMHEKWFGIAPAAGSAAVTVFPGYGVPDMPGYDPSPHTPSCG